MFKWEVVLAKRKHKVYTVRLEDKTLGVIQDLKVEVDDQDCPINIGATYQVSGGADAKIKTLDELIGILKGMHKI